MGEKYDEYEEDETFIQDNKRKEVILKLGLGYHDDINMNFQKYDGVNNVLDPPG